MLYVVEDNACGFINHVKLPTLKRRGSRALTVFPLNSQEGLVGRRKPCLHETESLYDAGVGQSCGNGVSGLCRCLQKVGGLGLFGES